MSLASRQKALDSLAKGKNAEALEALTEALGKRPTDLAAFTFRAAAEAERNALRQELSKRAEKLKPTELPTAAPPHKTFAKVDKLPKLGAVTLKRLSEERHDGDSYAFMDRNKIHNSYVEPPGSDSLAHFPEMMGELNMGTVSYYPDHTIVAYGPAVLMVADGEGALRGLNLLPVITEGFKAVLKPAAPAAVPDPAVPVAMPTAMPVAPPPPMIDPAGINAHIQHAHVIGSVLVAQLSHDGDGLGAKPDGFLVGYDLAADKLAWISDAGVATAYTFHAAGGYVVAAFSKTTDEERRIARTAYTKPPAGDAKLVVIDVSTGATVATTPLQSRADYVFGTKDRVFAWGDESIETFEITAAAPPPKLDLGSLTKIDGGVSSIPAGESTRCWLANAAIALDQRDGKALLDVARVLPEEASLTKGLRAAGEFLEERAAGRPGIDLTEVEPVPVKPLAMPKLKTGGPRVSVTPRRFVPVKESELYYPSGREELKKGEKRQLFAINAWPSGPSHLYPRELGVESIHWASRDGDDVVLAYGQRYVALIKANAVDKILDFGPFGLTDAPPASGYRPLTFITYVDDRVLLVNNPAAYNPKASTAFLASVDPKTGETVWRTEAGVLARQPIIFEEHVVALINRATTSELVAFRRQDGQAVLKQSFPELASDIGWDGRGAIFVTLPKEKKYFTFR